MSVRYSYENDISSEDDPLLRSLDGVNFVPDVSVPSAFLESNQKSHVNLEAEISRAVSMRLNTMSRRNRLEQGPSAILRFISGDKCKRIRNLYKL